MKVFSLSLEEDVGEWYLDLADNSYKTLDEFLNGFKKKWGEKKEPRHQLVALHNIKKMENETMEEFNKKFKDLVFDLHKDIKPNDSAILIYYIEAFTGDLRYQLRDKEPADLKQAQELAEKIEKNMQSSGKSNLARFIRGNSSYNKESKGKVVESEGKESSKDPMKEMVEMMKTLVTNQNQQMGNHVHN